MPDSRRPFRFGVQIAKARPAVEWKEQARRAEALGYDILVIPDHLGDQFAIGPALAVAAEVTTTLRIGTLVWQNDLRHPALVAHEAASLDVLSGGRFEFGIGAGGSFPPDYEWTGIPFEPPGTRVSRLEESLPIIKRLFGENRVTFDGRHYTITDLDGLPKPIQQPHPPVLVGGGGPRMLSLAAREADIVSIFPTMLRAGGRFREEEGKTGAFAKKVSLIRQAAGARFRQLELHILVQRVVISDNPQAWVERRSAELGRPVDYWLDSPQVYIGSVSGISDRLQEVRDQLGTSYFVVFESVMEEFAPIVARLAGR